MHPVMGVLVHRRSVSPLSRSAHARLLIAVALLLLVFVTACSSDDSDKAGSSTSTTFDFSGSGSEAFCAELATFSSSYADVASPQTTPDQLRTRWAALTAGVAKLESEAPSEIRSAITILRERIEGITPAFDAAGYVLSAVPQADRDRFQDTAAQDASDKITAYGAQICEPQSGK
jgi:hypothetical protein